MPQMSPMLWMNMMLTFMTILLISNSINYFMSLTLKKKNLYMKKTTNSWKW